MQQNSLNSNHQRHPPNTEKAVKSKASLSFPDGHQKIAKRQQIADLTNTEPRARKTTNRSVSGNSFGDRTLVKSNTKEVQNMAQLLIQTNQGRVNAQKHNQVELLPSSSGKFNNLKISSAQNTLNLRGNSRGQDHLDTEFNRNDIKTKKTQINTFVSPLLKKPVVGVKTNVNQSFTLNGFRQDKQKEAISNTAEQAFTIPQDTPENVQSQLERAKYISQSTNRNAPQQMNLLTGKLMVSQSIYKMNILHNDQASVLAYAQQYSQYKPSVIDQHIKAAKFKQNHTSNLGAKRDLNNISVTGYYLGQNTDVSVQGNKNHPTNRLPNNNPVPIFIHNTTKTIQQHYSNNVMNNLPSDSTKLNNASEQSWRLPSIQSQKEQNNKTESIVAKNQVVSPLIKDKNGAFNSVSQRIKFQNPSNQIGQKQNQINHTISLSANGALSVSHGSNQRVKESNETNIQHQRSFSGKINNKDPIKSILNGQQKKKKFQVTNSPQLLSIDKDMVRVESITDNHNRHNVGQEVQTHNTFIQVIHKKSQQEQVISTSIQAKPKNKRVISAEQKDEKCYGETKFIKNGIKDDLKDDLSDNLENDFISRAYGQKAVDENFFKMQIRDQLEFANDLNNNVSDAFQINSSEIDQQLDKQVPQKFNGVLIAYDMGEEPEEFDDEIRDSVSDEEGEEELPDDILIVEEENYPDQSSPDIKQMKMSKEQDETSDEESDQSVQMNDEQQQDINKCLYGGDIYLLGGQHYIKSDGDSSASTATTAFGFSEFSQKVGLKRKSGNRKKRSNKGNRMLKGVTNSILEEDEDKKTDYGGEGYNSMSNLKEEFQQEKQQPKVVQEMQLVPLNLANMSDKQKKHAIREEFLRRQPNQLVTLIKSLFPNREPFLFFPYAPFLKIQRKLPSDYSKIIQYNQEQLKPYLTLGFKVSETTHTYNCVVNSLKMAGFKHVQNSNWNVCWTGLFKQGRIKNLNSYQKINHFAGSWCIGRKDQMWRNVQRMRRLYGKPFDVAPTTYIFPEDYKRWQIDREINNFKHMYIMKPAASSCGRGIKVIGKKQSVQKRSGYIVSRYVSKPHLINGKKYDLRLYVLVTSYEPLKIYLFKDGLVRLATVDYTTSKTSLKQRFIHLTNYSVNKKAEHYVKNLNTDLLACKVEGGGPQVASAEASKLSFIQLKEEYKKMGVDYQEVFTKIKDVIIKTIISVESPILQCMGGSKGKQSCFEIYGFDILIDSNFKPWLLEVNVSPSLSSSSPMDKQIKTLLLSDSLYLIGFHLLDRKKIEQEKAQNEKQRLLGFEPKKSKEKSNEQSQIMGNTIQNSSQQVVKGVVGCKSRQVNGSQAPINKGTSFIQFENTYTSDADSPIKYLGYGFRMTSQRHGT